MCIDACKAAGLQPPDGHHWSEYDKSLFEISATEPDAAGRVDYCLEDKRSGKVRAIWFDQVMSHWTDLENKRNNRLPCTRRIDAFYVCDKGRYLIEFKRDGNLKNHEDKLWLKFHDSLTQLMEHGWMTLREAKEKLIYIVVRTGGTRPYCEDDFTKEYFAGLPENVKQTMALGWVPNELRDAMLRPWNYPVKADCGLWEFDRISCQRVLTLTVAQFDRYVQENHWA